MSSTNFGSILISLQAALLVLVFTLTCGWVFFLDVRVIIIIIIVIGIIVGGRYTFYRHVGRSSRENLYER